MQHLKKIPLIILFLLPMIGFSQINNQNLMLIKGTVFSGVNGEPLQYVNLTFSSIYQGTTTNENGEFKFNYEVRKNDSIEIIEISALGYDSKNEYITLKTLDTIDLEIILMPTLDITRKKAIEDIANGNIKILLSSGVSPIFYKNDIKFSKKYKLEFVEFGCQGVAKEGLREYNQTVFEYLDEEYGTRWRTKIRKDIVGLQPKE